MRHRVAARGPERQNICQPDVNLLLHDRSLNRTLVDMVNTPLIRTLFPNFFCGGTLSEVFMIVSSYSPFPLSILACLLHICLPTRRKVANDDAKLSFYLAVIASRRRTSQRVATSRSSSQHRAGSNKDFRTRRQPLSIYNIGLNGQRFIVQGRSARGKPASR